MQRTIVNYGAVPNSPSPCTFALQAAVDAAHAEGGGRVVIPPGEFRTGSIELKSGVEIHLCHGAKLLGSPSIADYPALPAPFKVPLRDNYAWKALFHAKDARDIALTGTGVIDGQGNAPDFIVNDPVFWNKVENRPHLLYFIGCKDVRIEGLLLRDSAFWMMHLTDCRRVSLRGVTVENFCNHNNDGMDFDNCRDVVISDCRVSCSDDALCFKSMTPGRNERIVVNNCVLLSHYNAIKVGTETAGGLSGLTISNCVLGGIPHEPHRLEPGGRTRGFAGLAFISADGAKLEDIAVSNCVIRHVKAPLFLRLQDRGVRYWPEAPERPGPGALRRVRIENIVASDLSTLANSVTGLAEAPVQDVTLRGFTLELPGGAAPWPDEKQIPEKPGDYPDCDMFGPELPASALYARHVRGLTVRDWRIAWQKPDPRRAFVFQNCGELFRET
ncbi:MAG: glycoside hydrolase family 28 protein [Terrimicrobiaceae bacterium]